MPDLSGENSPEELQAIMDAALEVANYLWGQGYPGIKIGMIGTFDGFTMTPPPEDTWACPTCQSTVLELVTFVEADHGHLMPCGCHMSPGDVRGLRVSR